DMRRGIRAERGNVSGLLQLFPRDLWSSCHDHCSKSIFHETSPALWSFPTQMKFENEDITEADFEAMDRRVIQVELPPAHAGITAALRRAFEAAASEP